MLICNLCQNKTVWLTVWWACCVDATVPKWSAASQSTVALSEFAHISLFLYVTLYNIVHTKPYIDTLIGTIIRL